MKKFLFLFLLAASAGTLSCKAQTNADVAGAFVKAISSGQYAEAAQLFAPEVGSAVNAEVLKGGWSQITAMFGTYQSYQIPEGDKNANPLVVSVQFEKETKGFGCNFNDKHQLTGFLLSDASGVTKEAAAVHPSLFKEEEVSIPTKGGTLKGTLMLPENYRSDMPVAIIIAGSGATDRNGNSGNKVNANTYQMLAETLAAQGIASLRYDKRMIGASNDFGSDESKLRFEDFVTDAVNIGAYLRQEKQTKKLYIIGHSEGAMIGMLAANRLNAAAYVSLCGAGENIAATLKRQIPDERVVPILDNLKMGTPTIDVPQEFQVVFRPSIQYYLISWMKYEPTTEIRKLKMPVLIVGGTTDIQVPVADAEALKKAKPDATLKIINGMNHVLKDAPADRMANMVTYNQPSLPLNAELSAVLIQFLKEK